MSYPKGWYFDDTSYVIEQTGAGHVYARKAPFIDAVEHMWVGWWEVEPGWAHKFVGCGCYAYTARALGLIP